LNSIRPFDCQIFSFAALQDANAKAVDPFQREHLSQYIVKREKELHGDVWEYDCFAGDLLPQDIPR